jgi:NTE family protein
LKSLASAAALLGAAGLLVACEPAFTDLHPIRNQPLQLAAGNAYEWRNLPPGRLPDTLVIVTASGGGTRAATLAMGVLGVMDKIKLVSGGSLADEIDVLSSVSGGSVTAGYFALNGPKKLDELREKFTGQDNIREMLDAALRPSELLSLWSPLSERVDTLIDYLDKKLYEGATFATLAARPRRPYLIVNAGDMVEGTVFPFTQPTFDLLCSDLTKTKVSTAVAASASFPFAYSPVTLDNYSYKDNPQDKCPVRFTGRLGPRRTMTNWYENPALATWQRAEDAYAEGRKAYIHLLDGGIADNLGISEPYRLLTQDDASPSFKRQIAEGRIKKIIVVTINARVHAESPKLDSRPNPPSEIQVLSKTVGAIRGGAANWTIEGLRVLLAGRFRAMAYETSNPVERANFLKAADNTAFLVVGFEAIPDQITVATDEGPKTCRELFNAIATNWTLKKEQVAGLEALGAALFLENRDFNKAMTLVKGSLQPPDSGITVADACKVVGTKVPTK